MRISDWSSDVCSSDLQIDNRDQILVAVVKREAGGTGLFAQHIERPVGEWHDVRDFGVADQRLSEGLIHAKHLAFVDGHLKGAAMPPEIGRPSGGDRVCTSVSISVVDVSLNKKTKK